VWFYRSDARRRQAFHDNRHMFARLSAFVIWSLVAATAVFWALRLAARPPALPSYAVAVGNSVAVRGDLSRLFGAPQRATVLAQASPEAPSRFKLVGVMAPREHALQAEAGQGVALIAVDGKPAKPYTVGARLDSDLVLQSVGLRTASIGPAQGARSMLLELPALAAPNTGVLPTMGGAPVPPAAMRPTPAPVSSAVPATSLGVPQPPMMQPAQPAPAQPAAPLQNQGLPTPGGVTVQ
jgi:general secretion pathway protein C